MKRHLSLHKYWIVWRFFLFLFPLSVRSLRYIKLINANFSQSCWKSCQGPGSLSSSYLTLIRHARPESVTHTICDSSHLWHQGLCVLLYGWDMLCQHQVTGEGQEYHADGEGWGDTQGSLWVQQLQVTPPFDLRVCEGGEKYSRSCRRSRVSSSLVCRARYFPAQALL